MLSHAGWLRAFAAFVGAAVFAAGAVTLFTIENSAGSLFLVTLGVVLLVAAAVGERLQLESLDLLGAKIRVREVVGRRLELARDSGGDVTP